MFTFLVYLSLTRLVLGLPLCDFVGGKFGGLHHWVVSRCSIGKKLTLAHNGETLSRCTVNTSIRTLQENG
jgi:hypothetical protein